MEQGKETGVDGCALKEGALLGGWKVVKPLARGGMAEVYEVEDARLGVRCALKLFTYDRGEQEAVRRRFFAEGRLLAKLRYPRLVRVYDIGEDAASGRPYFVMDLVLDPEGRPRTLADAGAEGVDEDQVAMWYEDLRDGLAYIHGNGILHRDLKLQNVLVGPDGHVVLSDFGVAQIFDSDLRSDLGLSAEQTLVAARSGQRQVMGSVGYLAPEVEMGVEASEASDWYALGVLVFRLLTGVWCDARTDVVGDLETYNPVWTQILPKLLHLNPAGRSCPSWRELERARREEEAFQAEKMYEEARDKLRRAKAAKKWLVAAIVCGLVAACAAGGALALFNPFAKGERLPLFEQLCALPADASDDDGASQAELKLAQIDAWVLTHRLLADVERGRITRERAVEEVRRLARLAAADDEGVDSHFEPQDEYEQLSEAADLARMLEDMADRLEGKPVE
jgi:serine/threonine protein kinase